jgi:threonine dehydrogenase-like Zn-dependent dehydrogenase
MKGMWLEDGQLSLRDNLLEPYRGGEALVRVTKAGICSTDTALVRGLYPFTGVIGHEFTGVVERGPDRLIGKRVVGEINATCGECRFCLGGMLKHCENRTVLGIVGRDGAFAERLSLPAANLHVIPPNVSDDKAVFTEPLAAAFDILEQVPVGPEDRVLVVGPGKLGQLVARVLVGTGAEVTVLGRSPEKMERLADLDAAKVVGKISGKGPLRDFDIAVECTGNREGFATALGALRPCGTLVLKSTYPGEIVFDATPVVVDEIRIVGSRCGPFDKALAALASEAIDPTAMIDARYPLGDGMEAFAHHTRPGVLKVLIEME